MIKGFRNIAWNGIQLSIPKSWEAVVLGERHILFEQDLFPLFEIRWEEHGQVDSFYKGLTQKLGFPGQLKTVPPSLKPLEENYQLYAYGKKGQLEGLFCHCPHCLALIHIHIHSLKLDIATPLSSLSCHRTEDEKDRFSIQDISFTVPQSSDGANWALSKYTFAAGTSTISFSQNKQTITYYRIANARKNIEKHSLEDILKGFSSLHSAGVRQEEWGYWLENNPTKAKCVLQKMKRICPYYHARIQFLESEDRILGISAQTNTPVQKDFIDTIWDNYEILL